MCRKNKRYISFFYDCLVIVKKFKKLRKITKQKIDIIVFGDFGSVWIKDCLPERSNHILITLDSVSYVLSVKFFFLVFLNIINGKGKMSLYYSLIETLDSKVIISFIDNQTSIGKIQDNFPDKLVISVQNGLRVNNSSLGGWGMNTPIPHYYGFGDYEKDLMLEKKARVREYIKAGSMKMGLVLSQRASSLHQKSYDICFVSSFKVKPKGAPSIKPSLDNIKHIFDILLRICTKNKYNLCVAMYGEKINSNIRPDTDLQKEICFYQSGNEDQNIKFIPNDFVNMKSYDTALRSKIIIGYRSTLLIELLGAKKKILFGGLLNPFDKLITEKAFKNLPGEVLFEEIEENHIRDKIEVLMNMTDEEYLDKTAFTRNYYMRCERPYPHEMINKRISEHLKIPAE